MKYIKLFEELDSNSKYLIELSSANSSGVFEESNPSEEILREAEEWWSVDVLEVSKIEVPAKYKNLSNETLTKLVGCREDSPETVFYANPVNDISYKVEIEGLSQDDVKKFRFKRDNSNFDNGFTSNFGDDLSKKAYDILYQIQEIFTSKSLLPEGQTPMTIEQKLQFFDELESDDYLIIRSSYIYKVVDGEDLIREANAVVAKLKGIINQ